jgi:hypothetical protein
MLAANLDEIVTEGPRHLQRIATAARGRRVPYILERDGREARLWRASR